jgi:hypothetical protein
MPGLLEQHGYQVRTLEGFLTGAVDFHALDASPNMTAAQKRASYDETREALRTRAAALEGSHVAYDPNDDGEGWLVVGSESEVRTETENMIAEREDENAADVSQVVGMMTPDARTAAAAEQAALDDDGLSAAQYIVDGVEMLDAIADAGDEGDGRGYIALSDGRMIHFSAEFV